ncbi:MAG: NUDIX hydrolase [Lewinellaceae bacterium]|nr:NUDIX hydrolase [Phaeodactylibacter sp.]MCB0612759.1 NUDIX hydrolase [Phaeodactylibacter sp.]MCB9350813.1 NUDIX hydrolase [Lewinellaceae bacterium]
MYKIYINGTPLFLATQEEAGGAPYVDDTKIVARYPGNPRQFLNYLDMLEKNTRFDSVTVYGDDAHQLFRDFASHFRIIEAAGGLVYNKEVEGEVLLIFKRDHWDLPKGKIDEGESRQEAAVREVMEETGLSSVEPGDYLGITYHTYRDKKNRRILKYTYWYRMKAAREILAPQAEEEIEHAEWRPLKAFLDSGPVVYGNIKGLLEKELAN